MLAFLIFILAPGARAQTGNWQAVENLAPGSRISVEVGHRAICFFVVATHDALTCAPPRHRGFLFGPRKLTFPRQIVREVRLEHSEAADAAFGAVIAGGIGVTVGAGVKGPQAANRWIGALFLGGVFGAFGGAIGRDFPLLHGQVVYKP